MRQLNLDKISFLMKKHSAVLVLLVVVLYGIFFVPNFLTNANLRAIMTQYSIIGLLALGQFLVILTGGIDLSQGSMVAFTSVVAATLIPTNSTAITIIGTLIACSLLGALNGIIVAKTKIPAFVATLGMMGIARGLAKYIANARPIPIQDESFRYIGRTVFYGVPLSFLLWVAISILLLLFLRQRRLGRYIYAVGSSQESARLAGINITKVKIFVYMMAALLAAIAGIVWAARLGSASPIGGVGYEMESIAAAVVGGTSLSGGVGSVTGTMAGVLLFGVINSILNLSGISPFWQGAIKGVIILVAVSISQVRKSRSGK